MMTSTFPLSYIIVDIIDDKSYSSSKVTPLKITFFIAPDLFNEQIGVNPL